MNTDQNHGDEGQWPDRLVDFVRARNHDLLEAFDSLRVETITGAAPDAARSAGAWRDRLAGHLRWEETWLLEEYGGRSRAADIPEIAAHLRDHEEMLELAGELADDLACGASRIRVRTVLDALDVLLIDHKEREENQVCEALDHVLDAPHRRAIEQALRR